MTTFSIVEDASVGASAVSAGVIASVKSNILAAAELWNRYFVQGAFDIKIELIFDDISGSTLATGGSGLTFSGFGGAGFEVWKVDSIEEYIIGGEFALDDGDPGTDDTIDISITVDTPLLLAGDFFFDPDPFSRTAAVPAGKNDFMSVMLHEMGHGFGFLSVSLDGMDTVDDSGSPDAPDLSPFDLWVDPDAPGGRSFVGPAATALFGGDIILDPGSSGHIAKASDGGFENLMDPSLLVGSRSFIAPIHIAMLDDVGLPVRKVSSGDDVMFGFDKVADVIDLLGGADSYSGLSGADSVKGGTGADTLNGDAGADTLDGGGAADLLFGGTGGDLLIGGFGADVLRGEAGNDTLDGGGGNDTLIGREGADSLLGGIGDDRLFGGDGNDTLDGGNRNDDRVSGQNGNDLLFGGAGIDQVFGGLDDDTIDGGGGNDRGIGGAGNDSIKGGAGNDSVTGGDGDDTVDGGGGVDTVIGGAGADSLIGGAGEDSLTGGDGNDTLDGGNRDDTLKGQGNNDILDGGNGNDELFGGGGADTLEGGRGDDTLNGNAGDDLFLFTLGDDADEINGFNAGAATDDVISLTGFGAAFDTFAEVSAAASDDGFGNTVIDFGGGDTITLIGVAAASLNGDDFIFA